MGGTLIEPVPKRISFVAIATFAETFGIHGEEFDRLVRLIRELDEEFLEISAEQLRARWQKMSK